MTAQELSSESSAFDSNVKEFYFDLRQSNGKQSQQIQNKDKIESISIKEQIK